jgi:uncharacterized protein (TIGR02452 family)
MIYSPGIVLFRDDSGEWRSPVEVDVLTSAAVNAGEIRRELEREERSRKVRVELEYWKRKREERRKQNEKATAERQRLREEVENQKEKEEITKLKQERAKLVKLHKEIVEKKETDKRKGKDSGRQKAGLFVENEKEEVGAEKPEGNQRNTIDREPGCGSDVHPPSPSTRPSQAPDPDPNLSYFLTLENAEIQIQQTMYARISRILHLFQLHKTPYLILGSFGTGVFKNHVELIATIFADLLIKPGGRFKDVFQSVVFAILGKETVRVFTEVFMRVDKRAPRERTGTTCVFEDWYRSGSDGDVKEGGEEKTKRMMRWEARRRRRRKSLMNVVPGAAAGATSFHPAQVDAVYYPLSFDIAEASAVPHPTSSAAADAISYRPSFNAVGAAYDTSSDAAHASLASCPSSSDTTQASAIAIPHPTFFTAAQAGTANPTTTTDYAIRENAKILLTRADEQTNFAAETFAIASITPKAMVIDDGKDIDTVETKSTPADSHEAQNSTSNKKEDGDDESLRLRNIAQETLKAINDAYVDFQDSNMRIVRRNIRQSVDDTVRGTEYFKPDTTRLKWWRQGPPHGVAAERHGNQSVVAVQILKMSTLEGAHSLSQTHRASKIGVLNFASAIQPGGDFMNGTSAQEESIARSSSLYLSLKTRQATAFYELHGRDNGGGYYSHSMIYSPSIAIFRDDNGNWLSPYYVDIVTSPAVNAGQVRKVRLPDTEKNILSVMEERMGRILRLFERSGVRNLVLGSFGTGAFQNDVGSLAKIWGELLGASGARFANSFDRVIFAIPDSYTRRKFATGFNDAANPPKQHQEIDRKAEFNFTNKGLTLTPHSHEAQNSRSNKKESGDVESLRLRGIAEGTIKAIKNGYVDIPDSNMRLFRHNIRQSADDTVHATEYFKPDNPWLKCWWQRPPLGDAAARHGNHPGVASVVQFLKFSILQGTHFLSQTFRTSKIGLLNFASATQPGGEFMNGASAEEESIARSSTLYLSLQALQATPFYELHGRDNGGGYYSHAIIYSPSVAIFRNDNGDWLYPYHVDIVSTPAINAGLVRKPKLPGTEREILSVMRKRMGRILGLFERSEIRNLVLGGFGTGFLQDDVESLAKIWGELIGAPGARFAGSFDQVIFAIPDSYTRRKIRTGFSAGAAN